MNRIIRWLVPREGHFFGYLERQATIAHEAAVALATLVDGREPELVAEELIEIERRGDTVVREMEEALAKTFVTPIDREDLQRLCKELDDVTDVINISARYFDIHRMRGPTKPMAELIQLLVDGTRLLEDALPHLRVADWEALMEASRSVRELEKKGDDIFREGIRLFFDDASIGPRDLMRQKEILEDLESAVDHCERVGNTLANFSVKHG